MKRSLGAMILAAALLSLVPDVGAKSLQFRLRKRFSTEMKTVSPTFYFNDRLRPMNRGSWLYLGQGLRVERDTFHFLDLVSYRRFRMRAPVAEMMMYHSQLLGDGNQVVDLRLLYLDKDAGQAGLQLVLKSPSETRELYFLHWDLARNRITRFFKMATYASGDVGSKLASVGYDHILGTYYFIRQGRQFGGDRQVTVFALLNRQLRVLARFTHQRRIKIDPVFEQSTGQALIVEYADLPLKGAPPQGFVLDLQSGRVKRIPVPVTTYGVTFSRSGRVIYAYSSERGEVWAIDPSGRVLRKAKVGINGHSLAYVNDNMLALIRNNSVSLLDPTTLRRGASLSFNSLARGFWHVGGSIVLPGRAIVKNGKQVYVLELKATL